MRLHPSTLTHSIHLKPHLKKKGGSKKRKSKSRKSKRRGSKSRSKRSARR